MEAKMALIEIVRKFKIETKVRISGLITVIPSFKLLRFSNFSKCSHMCKLIRGQVHPLLLRPIPLPGT